MVKQLRRKTNFRNSSMDTNKDPYLLTPGPLTTSTATKSAMMHDWGSRDHAFIKTVARVQNRILNIANADDTHVCVPLQGSGTFVVEATLGTLIPRTGKALVVINGAYGDRMTEMLDFMGREYETYKTAEDVPPDSNQIDKILSMDKTITHVAAVYCETTSGILNPIEEIAGVVAKQGRSLLIDAMSAFGALPLNAKDVTFDALMASSNKCLEGVPGMGFSIIRKEALEACKGNAHSLSLDLYAQWVGLEKSGQWRFTPPTQVIAALDSALDQFDDEGGLNGRGNRYADNCKIIVDGMREIGFKTLLPDNLQAPIIITFHSPADKAFEFEKFYNIIAEQGFLIYPGKLTVADSFRLGCIGHLGAPEMRSALDAVRIAIEKMGVKNFSPA
jgi:2-aminoethylphosphonate-pyruvate transaminase